MITAGTFVWASFAFAGNIRVSYDKSEDKLDESKTVAEKHRFDNRQIIGPGDAEDGRFFLEKYLSKAFQSSRAQSGQSAHLALEILRTGLFPLQSRLAGYQVTIPLLLSR